MARKQRSVDTGVETEEIGLASPRSTTLDLSEPHQTNDIMETAGTGEHTTDDEKFQDESEEATVKDEDDEAKSADDPISPGSEMTKEDDYDHEATCQSRAGSRRRGAIPPAAEINTNGRRARMFQDSFHHVLRQRLGQALFSDILTRRLLRQNNWDLDRAEEAVRAEFDAAKSRDEVALPNRNQIEIDMDYIHGAGSIHESHRRAIDLFYRRVNFGRASDPHIITALDIGLLLNSNSWIVEHALREFLYRQVNLPAQASATTETRTLRIPTTTMLNMDLRLATFMDITGVDDAPSARELLISHVYDVGMAVDKWMEAGMPNVQPSQHETRQAFYHRPRNSHNDTTNHWPADRPRSLAIQDVSQSDAIEASREYVKGSAEAQRGFLIRYDSEPARRDMPDPTKLRIESIRSGKYTQLVYAGVTIPGTGQVGKGREKGRKHRPIDWTESEDMVEINKWYAQPRRRLHGTSDRTIHAGYLSVEREWLYEHYRKLNAQSLSRKPGGRESGGRSLLIDPKELAQAFNAAFEGRRDVPGAKDDEPRPERTAAAISAFSKRQEDWSKEFGWKYSPAHRQRKGATMNKPSKEQTASPPKVERSVDNLSSEKNLISVLGDEGSQQPEPSTADSRSPEGRVLPSQADYLDEEEMEELRLGDPLEWARLEAYRQFRECERERHLTAQSVACEEETEEQVAAPRGSSLRRRKRGSSDDHYSDSEVVIASKRKMRT